MRQNLGLSAIIIAVIAFAIRNGPPGQQGGQSSQTQTAQPQKATNQKSNQSEEMEGPWLATRPFFHSTADPAPPKLDKPIDFASPSSIQACAAAPQANRTGCGAQLSGYFGIPDRKHIQFLIATLPDPLHSRLSLVTDSAIEAIEDAALASNWIFATQWLPWIDNANPAEKDPAKRREERQDIRRREKQPGILVFRRSAAAGAKAYDDNVLLVFVVGETPTAGINSAQFQIARAYMRAINEPEDKVRILGPTFSGSFYSLVALLKEDRAQSKVKTKYRVRSGTVTGAYDGAILQDTLAGFENSKHGDFYGVTANTQDQDRHFRSVLDDLKIDASRAALLIEDESAFGKGATQVAAEGKAEDAIRVLRFPRDISHLRNAYKEAVAASKSGNNPSPDIDFSIKDPETGEDSIPIFSGSQSPLSQNGVVNNIANAIQRDGIRLVRVDATNVLDMLFLANVLKRQCPDTRLVLSYPDVLLVQAAQNEPLTGTLVLASYPAFFASNPWMGGHQKNEPVTFPDANSESIYNAMVLLLNRHESAASKILADYHWGRLRHPPTWLLTLDRQGFLPVDVFPHTREDEKNETWFQKVRPPDGTNSPQLPGPPRAWSFVSVVIALACLVLSIWIWWISVHGASERDARFALQQISCEGSWRRFYILLSL